MSLSDLEISTSLQHILLSDYHYDLPKSRIAQHPLADRAASKLLHYQEGHIMHRQFSDLPLQLPVGSMLVLNNTQVVKARMYFQRATGAKIEVLLLHPHIPVDIQASLQEMQTCTWECVVGNKKRWKSEEVIQLTYSW
ncbi:MAG: S-adenosylmethionine:tRNA ribosyltransferase-isomerase, partial [Bacteroidota bacterium]